MLYDDLGEASHILWINICKDRAKLILGLSQSTYIDKVLRRFSIHNSKNGNLSIRYGIKLS